MRVFTRLVLIVSFIALAHVFAGAQVPTAGQVVISEFRFRGPNGPQDEFIELSNQTDSDITVATADNTAGWAVVAGTGSTVSVLAVNAVSGTVIYTIPVGTVIPARGHFLITNAGTNGSGGYSLGLYAQPDTDANNNLATYTYDIADDGGVAIYPTADPNAFNSNTRLDAAGFASKTVVVAKTPDAVGIAATSDFYEGTPIPQPVTDPSPPQFSFFRKLISGRPQDTNNNSNDFMLVSVRPELITSATAQLGAPGPESTASPVNRGDLIKPRLIDATKTVNDQPNRERNSAAYTDDQTPSDPTGNAPGVTPYANGWLAIRRRFLNNTGAELTGLRFRVVDITANRLTTPRANGTADIRALSSANVFVQSSDPTVCGAQQQLPCSVPVKGLKVDQDGPMPQPRGGGFNTSLSIDLSGNHVAIGGTVDVQFLLGVQEPGTFQFFVIVEALPGLDNTATAGKVGPPAPPNFDSTKRAGASTPPDGLPSKSSPARRKQ